MIHPTMIKENRQPIQVLKKASGAAAEREPSPPTAMRIPVMVANSLTRNHSASTFMVGTNNMETPRPTRVLPTMATNTDGAKPRMSEPMKATIKNSVMVRRGPHESESNPAGSCMTA